MLNPRGCQLFAVAALLNEIALKPADLLVEQVIGLVDQADDRIRDHGGIRVVESAGGGGAIGLIGPIGRTRPIFQAAYRPHCGRLAIIFGPLAHSALAQEVFVIEQELIEARPGNIYEAELSLAGGGGSATAFGDILPATACGLHHLVYGARALIDETRAEIDRGIVNQCAHSKAAQLAKASAGAKALILRSVGSV